MHTCTHAHMHIIHMHMHMHMHIHMHTCTHAHAHMYTCTCTHAHAHVYECTYRKCTCMCVCVCMCVCYGPSQCCMRVCQVSVTSKRWQSAEVSFSCFVHPTTHSFCFVLTCHASAEFKQQVTSAPGGVFSRGRVGVFSGGRELLGRFVGSVS
jgi:hypothetical protein